MSGRSQDILRNGGSYFRKLKLQAGVSLVSSHLAYHSSLYWSKLRPHFFLLWVYSHIGSWLPMTPSWPTQCLVQQCAHLHYQSSLGLSLLQTHLALCALSTGNLGEGEREQEGKKLLRFTYQQRTVISFSADVELIFLSRCLVVLCFAVQLHLDFPLQFPSVLAGGIFFPASV